MFEWKCSFHFKDKTGDGMGHICPTASNQVQTRSIILNTAPGRRVTLVPSAYLSVEIDVKREHFFQKSKFFPEIVFKTKAISSSIKLVAPVIQKEQTEKVLIVFSL